MAVGRHVSSQSERGQARDEVVERCDANTQASASYAGHGTVAFIFGIPIVIVGARLQCGDARAAVAIRLSCGEWVHVAAAGAGANPRYYHFRVGSTFYDQSIAYTLFKFRGCGSRVGESHYWCSDVGGTTAAEQADGTDDGGAVAVAQTRA